MTTIIGIQHSWGSVMAADSQITWGEMPCNSFGVDKITTNNGYNIGVAGEGRTGDIITSVWNPPKRIPNGDLYKFMINSVIPSLRKTLIENGWKEAESGKDNDLDIMISVKGQLFIICSDFTVVQDEEGFYGIGSGGAYAVGALYAGSTPEDAIRTAMKFDVNTGGNIQIMKQVRNA